MDIDNLDHFTRAYIECALWSSMDDNDAYLDENYGIEDLAPETLARVIEDCAKFQAENAADLDAAEQAGQDRAHAGHDFWLTRNGHGAGFWDGDYPDEVGERLTAAAEVYGSHDLYIGDDGLIYAYPTR